MEPRNVGAKLAARIRGGRSPLYRWLHQHRDDIAAVFASQSRPGWEALAATARDAKVLDATGKPPTRHAVRKAWKALQADLKQTPTERPVAALPIATERQPAALPRQAPPTDAAAPRERKPLVLRTARPLRPDETPDDDGSALPKPFSRTKQ